MSNESTISMSEINVIAKNIGNGVADRDVAVEAIAACAANVYSQYGEDGILAEIFRRVGTENQWCFECGAADGIFLSNTRLLIDNGWHGVLVESDAELFGTLKQNTVKLTCDCINAALSHVGEWTIDNILESVSAPSDIDFMSIDIDGQEFYVVNAMLKYKPRVICVEHDPAEYNAHYIPAPGGHGQAGRMAIQKLLTAKGYWNILQTSTNTIAVLMDLVQKLTNRKGNE